MVDLYDFTSTGKAVQEAYQAEEPFVIITKQPCALIKDVQRARAGVKCVVDREQCKDCKACLKIGCPAISYREKQVVIDQAMCNGCGLFEQVCNFMPITKLGE